MITLVDEMLIGLLELGHALLLILFHVDVVGGIGRSRLATPLGCSALLAPLSWGRILPFGLLALGFKRAVAGLCFVDLLTLPFPVDSVLGR